MRNYKVLSFFFLSTLTACNFAPKYSSPDIALPVDWRTESEVEDPLINVSWWKHWGDEVLDEYIQTALDHNKDLKGAIWRVNQYRAQYIVKRSGLFPQISSNGSAIKEKLAVDTDFLSSGINPITPNYEMDLSLSYELDFWGKVRNEAASANFDYLAQIEDRKTVVLTLVGSVAQAYVLLRQLDLQLQISRDLVKSRKESLRIATCRFEGGLTSKIEVDQSLAIYEESIVAVETLERAVPQQENLLCILLGEAPHSVKRGKTLPQLALPLEVPSGAPVDLLTRRPDIIKAENTLKAANANIGVARAAFFPQLNLSSLLGLDSLQLYNLFKKNSKIWGIGGSFLQQVFTGGALIGQLKIAEAQKQELLFGYEQTILNSLKEVNNSLIGLEKSKEIFKTQERRVMALKDYLELAWYRYYEGQTDYLTVVDAEREVFSAQIDMIGDQAEQFLVLVNLYKALGGGWVQEADNQAMEYGPKP